MLLARALANAVRTGHLAMVDAGGRRHVFEGAAPGPAVTVRLHDPALHWKLLYRPRLSVPQAYMDGTLTIEGGTLYDFLELMALNQQEGRSPLLRVGEYAALLTRRFQQYNPVPRARRNVAHHYDLSDQLYELFLDRDRQYSCAYFQTLNDDLETAQFNKKRHIAAKLLLRPGQKVLDIGCGWGGLALYLATECDVEVSGLTLSAEQHAVAERRAAAAGLSDRVRFHLRDYREERGTYDRIVSVGMFEHVGVNHYGRFFAQLKSMLNRDGVALLHAIGRMDGPGSTNPWLRKYIFPGGYSPALSEVTPAAEKARLWITDIEILRLHYAETLRYWRARFEQNRDRIRSLYDDRFCRMWELYLTGSEIAFRRQGHIVFQMQLAKAVDTVPLTRDYMVDWEHAHSNSAAAAPDRAA